MTEPLGDEIKHFVLQFIDSIAQVEILTLLVAAPEKHWSAESLTQELRSNEGYVAEQLENLKRKGLVKNGDVPFFSYAPTDSKHDKIVRRLVAIYPEKRVTIINLIYNKPSELIQGLADAFKVRKEDRDG